MRSSGAAASILAVSACLVLGGFAGAATVQTFGPGSAVPAGDRAASFAPLVVNGTPLSDYTEGGLFIGVDGDSWVGEGLPLFDPFHGANGSDRAFYFPFGGSPGWMTIRATPSAKIHAIEFMYGNGWTTGDIYGVPWGNHDAIVTWQTWSGGAMVSSGTIGGTPLLEMGTILGFYDPAGFDRLQVKCTIASSGDPSLQALALDNLLVQLTDCSAVNNCSGHGVCIATNTCACYAGWMGVDCSIPSCFGGGNCSGHGTCVAPDVCMCDAGWGGVDCSTPFCFGVANCSGHGTCVGPDLCMCDAGWGGQDCSIPMVLAAGRVPDGSGGPPLSVARAAGGAVIVAWGASCLASDTDYEVYEGWLADCSSHLPVACSTGGASSLTFIPQPGDRYFLAVPRNGSREGSYGLRSGGLERPPSTAACVPQQIGGCP